MQLHLIIIYILGIISVTDNLFRETIKILIFIIGSVQASISKQIEVGYKDDHHLALSIEILKGENNISQISGLLSSTIDYKRCFCVTAVTEALEIDWLFHIN